MIEVDKFLASQVESNKTPAIHYVLFNDVNIIHRFIAGYADLINHKKIDENTTFNAFSVTKTFTALAILQLHEKKMMDISESAVKYFPDFPFSSDITISQLLTHSAGIPNPIPLSWIHLEEEHDTFDRNKFFDEIFNKHDKEKSKPNEKFSYSNLGFVLLGQLIEKVSGLKFEDYIQENILKPLDIGPELLGFKIMDKKQHAKGYQKRFSFMNWILGFFMNKSKYMDKAQGKWKPFKNYYVNGASYGGLIGTPDAFVKYIQELLKPDCNLISDDNKQTLFGENFTNSKKPSGMCLSWFHGVLNGHEYFTHAGGGGGYYCEIRLYPDLKLGSVVMFNRSGITDERFLDRLDKYYIYENYRT